jgi:opine dehydrogenase
MYKITVIGCGNAGLIHAAKLIEKGYEVALLKTSRNIHEDFYNVINLEAGYNVKDETNAGKRFFVKPAFITRDVKKAIEFADIIFITTITNQHEEVAKLISPYVKEDQLIVLIPGYMGSLLFKKHITKNVIFSEWETTAYNGRIMDGMYVRITFYNPRNAISVLPKTKNLEVLDILSKCFDNTNYMRENILESAFHNPNMIVHTIGTLFSASRIEYCKGEFYMYKEAFTESIINVINKFDIQKNSVLKYFGCFPLDYFDAARWRNSEDLMIDSMEVFKSFAESSNKGPLSLKSRYLTEDVPMGLCLFSSIGKIAGINTSVCDSIIELASALLNTNLKKNSRTIEYLLSKDFVSTNDIIGAIN